MYYLGIDGGGTKTTGVLSDCKGEILRTKKTGPGNVSVLGEEIFTKHLKEIVYGLLGDEAVSRVKWATFGFAGAGREQEKRRVKEIISGLGIEKFSLLTDAELLYYSIHGNSQGILIVAGTGSVCIIRNNKNELEQLGGWGYLLGDEGSGYDLGRQAIREALNADERGKKPSKLTCKLLSFYQVEHPKDLITRVYSSSNHQQLIASSAGLVCELALKGERNAKRIVTTAASALLELSKLGIERLDTNPPYKIALSGGILYEDSPVVSEFKNKADKIKLDFEYVGQCLQPAAAGVLNSLRDAGEPVTDSLMKRLRKVSF
jgi:N-acetylglucosamine kinase-like BadF-type ATPase